MAATFLELIEKELPGTPSWIGPAVLPKRGVMLFGGEPKIGKSLINLELMRALAQGAPVFGNSLLEVAEPARVLMVEQEVGEYGLQVRAQKALAGMSPGALERCFYITQDPEMMLDSMAGVKKLKNELANTGANVLILDPISHMHGWDENDNTEITKMFNVLAELRSDFVRNDLSVVLSHHFVKPPRGQHASDHDPLGMNNFRGANKWRAAPDSLITVARRENFHGLPWKAWPVRVRYELRHGEPPDEMILAINRNNDLRVRYESQVKKPLQVKAPGEGEKRRIISL